MSSQSKNFLPPADPLGEKFCQYFNHGWNFIYAPVPQNGKPHWRTETRYPLQPRNLWRQYTDPEKLLGLRFGSTTRYGLLDIDQGSPNHPRRCPGNYRAILGILEDIGIVRTLVIQSSFSEGIHIYFFFPQPVPTFALACALQQSLSDEGYWVEDGRLEIFPNLKHYNPSQPTNYKAHRLPLQSGSAIVDDDLSPISTSLAKFLEIAESQSLCQDLERLEKVMAAAEAEHKKSHYHQKRSNRAEQWRKDLEAQIKEGWTDSGQTNHLLKIIGTFGRVFKGIKTLEDLAQYIYKKAKKLRGFKKHCGHLKDLARRAQDWASCLFDYYSPYCSQPSRNGTYQQNLNRPKPNKNQRRQQEAIERITQAMQQLSQTQTLPESASERAQAIQQTAKTHFNIGISKQTLYKKENLPLWHPDHQPIKPEQPDESAVSAESASPPPNAPETGKPASNQESSDPSLYEGLLIPSGAPAPQKAESAMSFNPEEEECKEENAVTQSFNTQSEAWRLTKVRLKLASQVQRLISSGGDFYPGKNASTQERIRQQELAKMFVYRKSDEPALIAEVRQWLQTSPDLAPQEWDLFF